MDWLDYREQLKIGFDDEAKFSLLITKVFNILNIASIPVTAVEYLEFCNLVGKSVDTEYVSGPEYLNKDMDRYRSCREYLLHSAVDLENFLATFVAFINTIGSKAPPFLDKAQCISMLERMMTESHIQYETLEDNDGYFVFPQGAKELDNALVNEPLQWLKPYPSTRKIYIIALKQYQDGIYIRDTADNLRKTLEAFLQEFLHNEKNLETNKNEICRYLGEQGVDAGISGLFQQLINTYKNLNDRIAKHNDKVDEKLLEFLLYQTGILIRMVLVVKKSEAEAKTNAD